MLKYFWKGALHGLILVTLGGAIGVPAVHAWLGAPSGLSAPSRVATNATAHRRAQKVVPVDWTATQLASANGLETRR